MRISKTGGLPNSADGSVLPIRARPRGIARTLAAVLVAGLALQFLGPMGAASASHSSTHFIVRQSGSNYVAESSAKSYTGGLKTVVESAVYNDLKPAGGGTVTFQAGVFDLGTTYFRLEEVSDIVFEGQGMDVTTIQNNTTEAHDTEPFNFKGAYRVTIRDLTVSAGGNPRTTSDAIDFDKGNDSLVQRVKITYSRGKGIIFDGKDAGWTSQGNTVLDCDISGTNNDGIQFLASTNNRVEGCYIHDTVKDGIEATKSQSNAPQPHKKSNDNVIIGNIIDNAGQNGIRIHSSDRNVISGNQITNSSDDTASQDGIRIVCDESITGNDNRVEGNTATDNQATKTQAYGLNIANSICNRTFVGTNNFAGNKTGTIRDVGTNTQYGTSDTTPPSNPTNLQATAVSSSRVDLTWTASTDNVGVVAYDIYRNASFLTSVGAVTTHSDTTVSPDTTYSYQVRARDSAGNPSGLSNTDTVTTPTGPPPPSVLTFTPTDDAYVRADQATTNFGSQGVIGVDSSPVKHTFLKFNISGIGTSSVVSAKLRLACIDSSDSGGLFYRVLNPSSWSEGTVTWNTSPAADTTQLASLGPVTANQAYEVDLTSLVTGDGLVSMKMTSNSGGGNGADYYSSEGSVAPQLIVTLSGGTADTTPPSNPSNLQATSVTSNRVDMTWTASTDNVGVTNYDIYRNSSLLTSVGAVTSFSDTTVSPNITYSYQVRARDAAGNPSGFSNTLTVTTPAAADTTPPSNPSNLQATSVTSNRVDMTWTASTDNVGVTAYDIYRNSSLLTSVGAVTSFSDTTVSSSTTYSYQVRARDAAGNPSGFSNTLTVTTPAAGAALFSDGFETGNFSNWTSNTGLVAQQQEVFAGSWGARGTTTSAATWAYKTLGTTQTQLYYRIRFKVISQGASSTVNVLKLRTATGTALFGLFRNTSGNLGYRNEVSAVSTNSTTPVSLGTWHEVQVRVRINGTSGESETWFDGVRIASLSKIENFGTTPIGRLQIGENSSGKVYDVAFDDVVASSSFIT
ncbi:MAG TPA: DNRLRE domain-containing protein [Actinomycetota bacterium]|nr:DNRLRE domain-containing protein [Actinomycetota bacterium]